MDYKLLDRYRFYFEDIPGWYDFEFVYILQELNEIHKKYDIKGNLLEIGVYLGKSFIPLSFLLRQEEQIIGVDCFEDQQFNTSKSGLPCSRYAVVNNLRKIYASEYLNIFLNFKLIKSDSRVLNAKNYINFTNNNLLYRIIYIDGGHDENTCSIDLNNSANILCKHGYIIIDDYKNFFKDKGFESEVSHGEGVGKAVDKFLLENKNFKIYKFTYRKLIIRKEY